MTDSVLQLLKDNDILLVKVPPNMTHLFQPLDLSTNGWAKSFMKKKFTLWYGEQINNELNNGVHLEDIDIKFRLSTLKPLHASWLIELYDALTSESGRGVILAGWRQAGILDAIRSGSQNLASLDPFSDLDGVDFNITPLNTTADESSSYRDEYISIKSKDTETDDDEDEEDEEGAKDEENEDDRGKTDAGTDLGK